MIEEGKVSKPSESSKVRNGSTKKVCNTENKCAHGQDKEHEEAKQDPYVHNDWSERLAVGRAAQYFYHWR